MLRLDQPVARSSAREQRVTERPEDREPGAPEARRVRPEALEHDAVLVHEGELPPDGDACDRLAQRELELEPALGGELAALDALDERQRREPGPQGFHLGGLVHAERRLSLEQLVQSIEPARVDPFGRVGHARLGRIDPRRQVRVLRRQQPAHAVSDCQPEDQRYDEDGWQDQGQGWRGSCRASGAQGVPHAPGPGSVDAGFDRGELDLARGTA